MKKHGLLLFSFSDTHTEKTCFISTWAVHTVLPFVIIVLREWVARVHMTWLRYQDNTNCLSIQTHAKNVREVLFCRHHTKQMKNSRMWISCLVRVYREAKFIVHMWFYRHHHHPIRLTSFHYYFYVLHSHNNNSRECTFKWRGTLMDFVRMSDSRHRWFKHLIRVTQPWCDIKKCLSLSLCVK